MARYRLFEDVLRSEVVFYTSLRASCSCVCSMCWVFEVGLLGVRTAPRADRPCDAVGGANMAALQWLAGFHPEELGNRDHH